MSSWRAGTSLRAQDLAQSWHSTTSVHQVKNCDPGQVMPHTVCPHRALLAPSEPRSKLLRCSIFKETTLRPQEWPYLSGTLGAQTSSLSYPQERAGLRSHSKSEADSRLVPRSHTPLGPECSLSTRPLCLHILRGSMRLEEVEATGWCQGTMDMEVLVQSPASCPPTNPKCSHLCRYPETLQGSFGRSSQPTLT